jgi:hypothetical protein
MSGILGDDEGLLGSTTNGSENTNSSQLGRISGKLLSANLLRNGVDIAVETDLLYLDIANRKISINDSTPIYDFDISSDIRTTDLTVDNQINVGNIKINQPNSFTTSVGGIDVFINGAGEIFHDILITDNLQLDNNLVSSFNNSNIVLDPNGTGTIELRKDTNLTGNLAVSGNINVTGNLTGLGQLVLGDRIIDTVTVNVDFSQSIIPGDDLTYTLGWDAGDSSPRRWAQIHSPDWTNISTGAGAGSGLRPQQINVNNQLLLDGITNKISALQTNQDVLLIPDTGITYIEDTKWQDSDLTNLNNTALTFSSTGIGYYNFTGSNAMVIPSGDISERTPSPEIGETRWNTEIGYLECFDGSLWQISTGGGEEVTNEIMEDLGHAYTLMLG